MNGLVRRIAVTIGALLVFRFGSHIRVAGILTEGDLLSSAAVYRALIFALVLVAYLSAVIVIQSLSMVRGRLGALERFGDAGRREIGRITLILTLVLASFQAFDIASAMQNISGLVTEPGGWLLLSASEAGLRDLGRSGRADWRLSRPPRVVDDGGWSRLLLCGVADCGSAGHWWRRAS